MAAPDYQAPQGWQGTRRRLFHLGALGAAAGAALVIEGELEDPASPLSNAWRIARTRPLDEGTYQTLWELETPEDMRRLHSETSGGSITNPRANHPPVRFEGNVAAVAKHPLSVPESAFSEPHEVLLIGVTIRTDGPEDSAMRVSLAPQRPSGNRLPWPFASPSVVLTSDSASLQINGRAAIPPVPEPQSLPYPAGSASRKRTQKITIAISKDALDFSIDGGPRLTLRPEQIDNAPPSLRVFIRNGSTFSRDHLRGAQWATDLGLAIENYSGAARVQATIAGVPYAALEQVREVGASAQQLLDTSMRL